MQKLDLLILVGPPGSGKSTLAASLETSNHYHAVSTGTLLRNAAQNDPALKDQLASGTLSPDATVERLLVQAVKGHRKVLLDGYPRTMTQVRTLRALFPYARIRTLNLGVPDDLSLARIRERNGGSPAGQQRPEDAATVAMDRLMVFHRQTSDVIRIYAAADVLSTIDGHGTPEEVHTLAQYALQHAPDGYRQRARYSWKQLNKYGTMLERIDRRIMQEPHHFRDRDDRVRMSRDQQLIFIRQGLLNICLHGQPLNAGELVRRRRGLFGGRWRTATIVRVGPDRSATLDWGEGFQSGFNTGNLKRA